MTAGDNIPKDNNVSRYCKPRTIGTNELPLADAFYLREDEIYLSVNWVEFISNDINTAVEQIRDTFIRKGFGLSKNGRFAILNVGKIQSVITNQYSKNLRIQHLPFEDDQSHSGILDFTSNDLHISLAISILANKELIFPGK